MKTFEEIDVYKVLTLEDFITLFAHLPLTEEEKIDVKTNYYTFYKLFIDSGVDPGQAWLAVKNIFIIKNQQIAKRIKQVSNI
jgi:hypothetical protein